MTGFVFLDKEQGMTSFSAANRLRRIFGVKKAGHTGTLDPMATGVLPVALGSAARFIELIPNHDKGYVARFRLGVSTDTLDITGTVTGTCPVHTSREQVQQSLGAFRGEILQVPPMYSAIKKDGVRLYDLARQGIEVERESRRVSIYELEMREFHGEENEYEVFVRCSKGTYIRSLIRDIGQALECPAVMTSLRRVSAHGVEIAHCKTLAELEEMRDSGRLSEAVHSVDSLLGYEKIKVTGPQAKRFANGGELDLARIGGRKKAGYYSVYSPENRFLGVGEITEDDPQLRVKKVYVE
ncbi:MAG: tRNA pseudouridine(55) synthase TruB [Oscillospiraceae bacterium]|nr:tRNA pseudouridine(55) synthase TruB [Oscillospiraceae bacterium]MDD6146648.1 tRNA pseudouridine(55) synthase TruB [Oscillospiraceae bacterium]